MAFREREIIAGTFQQVTWSTSVARKFSPCGSDVRV